MRKQLGIALLAFLAAGPGVRNGFAYDDVLIIAGDSRIHHLAAPWRFFTQTYWEPALGGRLYRPLTSLAFAVEWRLGQGEPWLYHVINLLLYILICLLLYRLAVVLLGSFSGWWAAALFAVHPVHVEAVANSVGQAELWAALFVIGGVGYCVAIRRKRALETRDVVLITAAYALACLFKEHALMMPALLAAAELTILRKARPQPLEPRAVLLLGATLTLTGAAFWLARGSVIGNFVGDRSTPALYGLSPFGRLLTMLGVVPEWARLLFFPMHLQADYLPQEIQRAESFGWAQVGGVALLLLVSVGALAVRRRQPVVTFAVLWAAVTLFPVSNVLVVSGVILAERTLFLPSVGAVLAVAAGIDWARVRALSWPASLRQLGIALGMAVLLAGAFRSALRAPVWRDNETLFAQTLIDAPRSYRAHWLEARRLNDAGDRVNTEREYRLALSLFPYDAGLLADAADRYGIANRCEEALPLYRRSLGIDSESRLVRTRFIRCLVRLRCVAEARAMVAAALAHGDLDARDDSIRVDSLTRALDARPDTPAPYAQCDRPR